MDKLGKRRQNIIPPNPYMGKVLSAKKLFPLTDGLGKKRDDFISNILHWVLQNFTCFSHHTWQYFGTFVSCVTKFFYYKVAALGYILPTSWAHNLHPKSHQIRWFGECPLVQSGTKSCQKLTI